MRIALLGPANSIHLQRWAAALAARGHALAICSQHRCDPALLPPAAQIVWLPHAGSLGYFRNAGPLRAALAAFRPDLLNAHYASGYGSTARACGFAPTLLSVWGSDVYDFPFGHPIKGWLVRGNLRHATAIASTSLAMADQVRRLITPRAPIAITPFGVDTDRFTPAARGEGPLTIGTVKSLAPKYGIDLLLRAFAGLRRDTAIDCRLRIVGEGPERAALQALARELGIAAETDFSGAVAHDRVPSELARLDIYAAPSRLDSESFGVAVIEASACARPVVVSDVGGLPEVVREGDTGLVVPRENVQALQAALTRLARDPALRERLGRRGREHVLRHYEWQHCVDAMERAYRDTIARACPR